MTLHIYFLVTTTLVFAVAAYFLGYNDGATDVAREWTDLIFGPENEERS